MSIKLEELTDDQFKKLIEDITMEAERREIVIQGTKPIYKKSISGPVITALMKMQRRSWELGRQELHKIKDLDLTDSEKSNLSTLRQAGLIAHVKDEAGEDVRGVWIITRMGRQFLRGEVRMPACIYTMANHKIKNQPEERLITIQEAKLKKNEMPQYESFVAEMNMRVAQERNQRPVQTSLIQ